MGGGSQARRAVTEWPTDCHLPTPTPAPWPFNILFVGVNSSDKADLSLKEEFQKMESALEKAFNSRTHHTKPSLKPIPYSTWKEVMHAVRRDNPTNLHFGCHAQASGLELFEQTVQSQKMIQSIEAHNEFAREKRRGEIRVVVINACKSDKHAQDLSACVDFTIGHKAAVGDRKTIDFTESFYSTIFQGMHLAGSLISAKNDSSEGYQLHPHKNPRGFIWCVKTRAMRDNVTSGSGEMKKGWRLAAAHQSMAVLLGMVVEVKSISRKGRDPIWAQRGTHPALSMVLEKHQWGATYL